LLELLQKHLLLVSDHIGEIQAPLLKGSRLQCLELRQALSTINRHIDNAFTSLAQQLALLLRSSFVDTARDGEVVLRVLVAEGVIFDPFIEGLGLVAEVEVDAGKCLELRGNRALSGFDLSLELRAPSPALCLVAIHSDARGPGHAETERLAEAATALVADSRAHLLESL